MIRTIFAGLAVLMLFSGCSNNPALTSGQEVYSKYCATCHQAGGEGIDGAFPSLHDSEWVAGDKGRLIRLVLRGMQGPLVVKGKTFNNAMTPHSFLSDDQVASVLSFVRQEFGNEADEVLASEVAAVRASLTSEDMYIASELEVLLGIPSANNQE